MSDELGTYTFLPWLRQGLANKIVAPDLDPNVKVRPTIKVQLELQGDGVNGAAVTVPISRDIALYGPGDIIGIESRAIIRTEPQNWVTNFEPNYLPYVDFYDENFVGGYTPSAPDGNRLRPWISLVVLAEDEFKEGANLLDKPLPYIEVTNPADVFPPAEELWAWAHIHTNRNLVGDEIISDDTAGIISNFENLLDENPDLAYSRLLCPRKLGPNTRYHAFLIPTFESGRLAGLGIDPVPILTDEANETHATFSAWATYPGKEAPTHFPIYYRWFFRTGSRGDFEYLVRLLEPKPADKRVGRRDMDVQRPGLNISGIEKPELDGILKLGGALQVPFGTLAEEDQQEILKYDNWAQPYPQPFQTELAAFVNLADDYAEQAAADAHQNPDLNEAIREDPDPDPDPLITPPIYGRWHALTQRLLKEREGTDVSPNDNWVHELNLDPRWRVAAGVGTKIVQQNQEEYMDGAWDQVGEVVEANRRIRQAQLAKQTSFYWYNGQFKPLTTIGPDKILWMTAPVQKRVLSQGITVYHQVKQSLVTPAVTSTPLRRMLRPRSRLMKYSPFDAAVRPTNLVTRVNAGEVSPAPPKTVPPELPTLDDVADDLKPEGVPDILLDALSAMPWLKYLPLILAILLIVLLLMAVGFNLVVLILGVALIIGAVYLYRYLDQLQKQIEEAESILEENQTPESVDDLPQSPDFTLTTPIPVDGPPPTDTTSIGASDSPESTRFKNALKHAYTTLQASLEAGRPPQLIPLDIPAVAEASLNALDPKITIPRYTFQGVTIPANIWRLIGEKFVEAMAYPEFDFPMYKPLVDLSDELFVPNLNFIEQNTITLLETNQKFIEAYMVGLNHEFARELLWREYPTDQRGSYFRQFWDVSSFLSDMEDTEALRESLKDIPPLHRWSRASNLGDHDHREAGRENEEELVVVIRGELLKKYPNTVIYAHKAKWQPKSETDPTIDKAKERRFDENEPIKSPLYEAQVAPDIYFFGFDLTATEARGDDTVDDKPGWFIVMKERSGQPRFGLDIEREGPIQVWNDLAWNDVVPDVESGDFITIGGTATLEVTEPTSEEDQEKHPQWEEDRALRWHAGMSSAEIAYILFQAPVLVGIHASEMLPED